MSSDESFFREVDEDYRREQAIKFFKTYGAYFIAGAFIILAVVGGYTFERNRRANQAAIGGDDLLQAMILNGAGKSADAEMALAQLAKAGPGPYKVIARLQSAAESVGKNQLDVAAEKYRAVAGDESAPSTFRDFARIQLAALSIGTKPYDALAKDLETYRSGTSKWRFSAKEILGLAAYQAGKTTEAERLYRELASDGGAPQGMRDRAQVMLALLGEKVKASSQPEPAKRDKANEPKTQ